MRYIYKIFILIFISGILSVPVNSFQNKKRGETKPDKPPSNVLIVTYSMTEKTKAVAKDIAKRFKSDMVFLKAPNYEGMIGGLKANNDAWNEVTKTKIKPEKVDMSGFDLIFLGSPIWWYRPAVPLWTFVTKNNFHGKQVVLFNTFNSKFEKTYIDKFKKLLKEKGGVFLNHIYVRRGRWFSQLTDKELLKEFNKKLDKAMIKYKEVISRGPSPN